MPDTSLSLLNRAQDSNDRESWDQLVALYVPLLQNWLRRYDVRASDADDIVQEVLVALSIELPSFKHSGRDGAFRKWLRLTLVHRLRNYWKAQDRRQPANGGSDSQRLLAELEDPATAITQLWNRNHDRHVVRQLLAKIQPRFAATTWQAFYATAVEGAPAKEVAKKLGISANSVFVAKSRVLSHLRREVEGLVDSSGQIC
jgi:RNA polymerase sigma-70 factor, ECF subfamily